MSTSSRSIARWTPCADVTDQRPDPDALLRAAAQEGRGRLKIFLGAAPGVGKTYEMLSEGAARRRDGAYEQSARLDLAARVGLIAAIDEQMGDDHIGRQGADIELHDKCGFR